MPNLSVNDKTLPVKQGKVYLMEWRVLRNTCPSSIIKSTEKAIGEAYRAVLSLVAGRSVPLSQPGEYRDDLSGSMEGVHHDYVSRLVRG